MDRKPNFMGSVGNSLFNGKSYMDIIILIY